MKSHERRLRVLESCERVAAIRDIFREAGILAGVGPDASDGAVDEALIRLVKS